MTSPLTSLWGVSKIHYLNSAFSMGLESERIVSALSSQFRGYFHKCFIVQCLMAPQHILSQDTINHIFNLYKAGFSAKDIVEETGVAKRTVERWLKRCR